MPRRRAFATVATAVLSLFLILFLLFPVLDDLEEHFDFSWEKRVEDFDFKAIADEKACFRGDLYSKPPIPNVVHLIWLNNTELTFINYLTIRSALGSLQPDQLNFHYTDLNEHNQWFTKVRDNITLVQHNLENEYGQQIRDGWQIAHIADLLRLDIIYQEGGIYLDMDVIALRSFDRLLGCDQDLILGNEGGDRHGLCNAIIVGRSGSAFVKRWRESYSTFATDEWNYHSVILPKTLAGLFENEICAVSPSVFYWPTWTANHIRYMHSPLTENEALAFQDALIGNGDTMYPDQLAYHAWSQVSSSILKDLSPEKVLSHQTRFNMLVRRFLD